MAADKLTILAIDDNRDNLTVLKAVVADRLPGTRFITAMNGRIGIEMAGDEDPDVILLDIVMPGMDGYSVCLKLKEDESTKTIPVLFLTALKTDRKSRIRALESGADGFLSKPFDEVELVAQIQAMAKIRVANRLQRLEKDHLSALVVERTRELEQELSERNRVENALRESEAKMRTILDNIGIGIALISPDMETLEINRQMHKWFPATNLSKHPLCYRAFNDPPREAICEYCPTCKTLKDGLVHETTTTATKTGIERNFRIISSPIFNMSGKVTAVVEMFEEITQRLLLESQLQQAQKMESVGRLAGGVAHDFNNMLGVILGYTEMALDDVTQTQPIFSDLQEIGKAARRAADLTRQLLAFARKQTIIPKVLDLNETVQEMLKMLQRLIGENLDLVWLPCSELWKVKLDPSQIDQILANLCVNARDAIKGVGRVTIRTENVNVDRGWCEKNSDIVPGEFVLLSVSDDGCGMDRDVVNKVFEPFFTTKEVGKGTGLGLATVYGIVRQNSGFINVYSEPDKGTSFKIYLPRYLPSVSQIIQTTPSPDYVRGQETILLVEDESAILELTTIMLRRTGYTVLTASTPDEAIRLTREHSGRIDLLLTDVVMPRMNGRDLAEKLVSISSHLRCLFMSGYTTNIIAHQGVVDEGVHFIQKPFSMKELTAKVRGALDGISFKNLIGTTDLS